MHHQSICYRIQSIDLRGAEFCDIGVKGETEFALSLSDADDAFVDAVEACADARTERACSAITGKPEINGGGPEASPSSEAPPPSEEAPPSSAEAPGPEDDYEVTVYGDPFDDTDTPSESPKPLKPSPVPEDETEADPSPSPEKNDTAEPANNADDPPDMMRARDFSPGSFLRGSGGR